MIWLNKVNWAQFQLTFGLRRHFEKKLKKRESSPMQIRWLDPIRRHRRLGAAGRSLSEAVDDGGKSSEWEKARFCAKEVVDGELLRVDPSEGFYLRT